MSEFDFDEWVDYLKYAASYEGYEPDISDISDEEAEEQIFLSKIGYNFPLTIQIMESGIFREAKLKGRKISEKYRLYPIEDIKEFIIELVNILNRLENMKERKQRFTHQFESIISEFDLLSKMVLECKGVRPEKLKAIRHDLAVMKDKTLNKLNPVSSLPSNIIPTLINLFKKYIQNAPNQTIATRISELLKIVDFQVNQETIRKKLQAQIPIV
jgi:Asp-tRNA(Asn)/Glu-tRNA(Gln) amidotransferase C subunit